jgi:hypothetical protein
MKQIMKSFLLSGSNMRNIGAKVAWDQVCLPKKKGGVRNKKDNRMEQDCFVETHLEPVQ